MYKLCAAPGCRVRIEIGADAPSRCSAHALPPRPKGHGNRRPVEDRRGSARQRGYSPAWDRLAKAFLRANPLCALCSHDHRPVAAELVDHVTPIREAPDRIYDYSNLQSLCRSCHARKTHAETRRSIGDPPE